MVVLALFHSTWPSTAASNVNNVADATAFLQDIVNARWKPLHQQSLFHDVPAVRDDAIIAVIIHYVTTV